MSLTDIQADRLFDSMLARVEAKLGREILNNFNELADLLKEVISTGGQLSGNVLILQNQENLKKILEEAYRESIVEGVIFARRDLDLPEEEDDSMTETILLLLLLWIQDQSTNQAQLLTDTTVSLFSDIYEGARGIDIPPEEVLDTVVSQLRQRNRGRVRNIATSEAGEALSRGQIEVGEVLNKRLLKSWRSQEDLRVRDSHSRANLRYRQEPIPLNENFIVGSSSGPFPRSSQLSMEERNGCRCYLRFIREN